MTTNITQIPRVVNRTRTPVNVTAERTALDAVNPSNDWTMETTVSLNVIDDGQGRRLMILRGGPTGQAAFELSPQNIQLFQTRSWVACRGERGGVDRLVVPSHEMIRAFAAFGIEMSEFEAAA